MTNKLLSYQLEHVNSLATSIKKYKRALDASDTGTGKTYTTIALCKMLKLKPFIICPKSVVSTWINVLNFYEYNKFEYVLTTYNQILNHSLIKKIEDDYEWKFTKEYIDNEYLFIYDEAHNCKNKNTINAKILIELATYDVNIILLSATIVDKPLYFNIIGYVLGLYDSIDDGMKWMNDLCDKKSIHLLLRIHNIIFPKYASRMSIDSIQNPSILKTKIVKIGDVQISMQEQTQAQEQEQAQEQAQEQEKEQEQEMNLINKMNLTNKVKKSDKVNITDIFKNNTIQMDGVKMDNYFDIIKEYNILNDMVGQKSTKNIAQIQLIRMRIEILKVNSFVKLTNEYVNAGKSVAIFVNFTNTLLELSKRLNTRCIIYGQQTINERIKSINDFCTDKARIIICNIQSGGSGVSLHDTLGNFPRVSLISPTWSAQNLMQVLGRVHRATGKSDVLQRIIFCKDTFEENIGNMLKHKINNIRMLNNGVKTIANDNMEKILLQEYHKKEKIKENDMFIYKTNNFDKINERLENLYKKKEYYKKQINQYDLPDIKIKEFKYFLEEIDKQIVTNEKYLETCIKTIMEE
jgi:superfamily II DNA or RNA helicase